MSELFRRKIESTIGSEKINSFNFQIFKDSPNQLLKIKSTKPTIVKKPEPIKMPPAPVEIKKQETSVNLKNLTINEIGWHESTSLNPPQILIFGDIESESLEEQEVDLELPKWGLLHKICQALKFLKSHLPDLFSQVRQTFKTAQTLKS